MQVQMQTAVRVFVLYSVVIKVDDAFKFYTVCSLQCCAVHVQREFEPEMLQV